MAESNEIQVRSKGGWLWNPLQVLLLFVALLLGLNALSGMLLQPEETLRMTYLTGGPNCAEFARHLEANNAHGVHFTVTPLAGSSRETGTVCSLDLGGQVTSWYVGDENRPLVAAAQSFTPRSGSVSQELIITRPPVQRRAPLVVIPALLLTALWVWRRHRSDPQRRLVPSEG